MSDLFGNLQRQSDFFLRTFVGLRDDAGLRYGDSDINHLVIGEDQTKEFLLRQTGFPTEQSTDELLRTMSLPINAVKRQKLDERLSSWLDASIKLSWFESQAEDSGVLINIPIDERLASLVNTGYADSEPFYKILIDDQVYTVSKAGSKLEQYQEEDRKISKVKGELQNQILDLLSTKDNLKRLSQLSPSIIQEELSDLNTFLKEQYRDKWQKSKPQYLLLESISETTPEQIALGHLAKYPYNILLKLNNTGELQGIEMFATKNSFNDPTVISEGPISFGNDIKMRKTEDGLIVSGSGTSLLTNIFQESLPDILELQENIHLRGEELREKFAYFANTLTQQLQTIFADAPTSFHIPSMSMKIPRWDINADLENQPPIGSHKITFYFNKEYELDRMQVQTN